MEGVEADARYVATCILSNCAWKPAVGLDGQPVSAETVLFFHGGRSGRDSDDPYRPPPTGRGGAYAYGTRDDPWYPVNRQP
jgi:hypothetical protein